MSDGHAQPVLTIFAGPNGSGKSTLKRQFDLEGYDFGTYINADELLKEELANNPTSGDWEKLEIWAFHQAEIQRAESLAANTDFCFETVFSHPSKLDFMESAKRKGYFIRLFFVATESSQLNIARVAKRVHEGGHDVETHKILSRYIRTLSLLPFAFRHSDQVVLYDNSTQKMRLVVNALRNQSGQFHFKIFSPIPNWVKTALTELSVLMKGD